MLSGERQEIGALAEVVLLGNGRIVVDKVDNPAPYDVSLSDIRVFSGQGLVVWSVDEAADLVAISGDPSNLRILSENLLGLATHGIPDEHQHFEYFPGHYYLDPTSVPVSVELLT